jgi:hypothetical protein
MRSVVDDLEFVRVRGTAIAISVLSAIISLYLIIGQQPPRRADAVATPFAPP